MNRDRGGNESREREPGAKDEDDVDVDVDVHLARGPPPSVYDLAPRYTAEQVGKVVSNKVWTTSAQHLDESQLYSFNQLMRTGLGNDLRTHVVWSYRFKDELWKHVIESVTLCRPQTEEASGMVHKLSPTECRARDMNLVSPVNLSFSVYCFAKSDPSMPLPPSPTPSTSTLSAHHPGQPGHSVGTGTGKKRSSTDVESRTTSKTKRVRTDLMQNSMVRSLLHDEEDHGTATGTGSSSSVSTVSWLDLPEYHRKLAEAQDVCRLSAYERDTYKYLVRFEHHQRMRLCDMGVPLDSIADHATTDLAQAKECLMANASMIINGRPKIMMRTPRLQFNYPFLRTAAGSKNYTHYITMRCSYINDEHKSSPLLFYLTDTKASDRDRMMAKIQFIVQDVNWVLLFFAMGWTEWERIEAAVLYAAVHFFTRPRSAASLPLDDIRRLLRVSFDHARALAQTQTEACQWLGWHSKSEDDARQFRAKLKRRQTQVGGNGDSAGNVNNSSLSGSALVAKNKFISTRDRKRADDTPLQELQRVGKLCVCRDFLPFMGNTPASFDAKAMMAAHLTAKLLLAATRSMPAGAIKDEQRNNVIYRRLQPAADWLVTKTLRQGFQRHFKDGRKAFVASLHRNEPLNTVNNFDHGPLSKNIQTFLATGISKNVARSTSISDGDAAPRPKQDKSSKSSKEKTGLCQIENNANIGAKISQKQRINGNVQNHGGGASMSSRQIENDWGMQDVVETPEGPGCGEIKPTPLLTRCSAVRPSETTLASILLRRHDIVPLDQIGRDILQHWAEAQRCPAELRAHMVLNNGKWLGMASPQTTHQVATHLDKARYALFGEAFLTLARPKMLRQLCLYTDVGRLLQLLVVVDKLARFLSRTQSRGDPRPLYATLTFDQMLAEGFLIYACSAERDALVIALDAQELVLRGRDADGVAYTHMELSPETIFGLCAGQVPFPDHNQSPRNTYQANMGKSAMAGEFYNMVSHLDTLTHSLIYVSRPIVRTMVLDFLRFSDMASGIDGFMVIMALEDNQEDAVIMNTSSIDRGFHRSVQHTTICAQEKKHGSIHSIEHLCKPSRTQHMAMKPGSYARLDDDGLPFPGRFLNPGDAMIGKAYPVTAHPAAGGTGAAARLKKKRKRSPSIIPVSVSVSVNAAPATKSAKTKSGTQQGKKQRRRPANATEEDEDRDDAEGDDDDADEVEGDGDGEDEDHDDDPDPVHVNEAARTAMLREEVLSTHQFICNSVMTLHKNAGVVDQVLVTCDHEGMQKAKVRMRKTCKPVRADKFSSRHGQKGTYARGFRDDQMPWGADTGLIPMFITNPHGIPSRMTVGHLLETSVGKSAGLVHRTCDATAFGDGIQRCFQIGADHEDEWLATNTNALGNPVVGDMEDAASKTAIIGRFLHRMGMQRQANERFYHPDTGELIGGDSLHNEGQIFGGVTHYQKLAHRAEDKLHRRARGPRHLMTRQPIDGGSRAGGFRHGEMETTCAIAHGVPYYIDDRNNKNADPHTSHVCTRCSNYAQMYIKDQVAYCKHCKTGEHVHKWFTTFGWSYLRNSVFSVGMFPRYTFQSIPAARIQEFETGAPPPQS